MKLIAKLVLANVWQRPARMCLTLLAIIAAACVVVWVVGSYDALLAQFDDQASTYLDRYSLVVVPESPKERALADELVAALRADAAVAEVNPVTQTRVRMTNPNVPTGTPGGEPMAKAGPSAKQRPPRGPGGRPGAKPDGPRPGGVRPSGGGRPMMMMMPPALVGTDAAKPPYELVDGQWIDAARADRMAGVLSERTAEQFQIKVGDDVLVSSGETGENECRLRIVGIVKQSTAMLGGGPGGMRGPASAALYVPVGLAEKITGEPARVQFINLLLKDGATAEAFQSRWKTRLAESEPAARVLDPAGVRSDLEEGMMASGTRNQAYAATGMSLLAALFIIFTTLSMGVHERIRQLAVLRAVALTRGQVAALIVGESLILAVLGWAGGLAAGWGLLKIAVAAKPELFRNGATLGAWCVMLTGACAFGGALAASILPAWHATRVSPLDAMSPQRGGRPGRWSAVAVVAGLTMIAVNPLLVFFVSMPDAERFGIYAALGCTSMAVGFVLLAPATVVLADRLLGPPVAWLLGIDRRMLASQLSSNLGRTLGTTVALTVGLGLFVAMQTWGYTMLRPFVPGPWVPEVLVAFQAGGLPDGEIENVRNLPGVIADECLPLAVEQPKLADDITGSEEHANVARQDNVVLIGVDPAAGLGGKHPLLNLDFVQGSRDDAVRQLQQGRGCLVPDHFARVTGLRVGDSFRLVPPEAPQTTVEYKIAGVVSLPGWHWMTKLSGLRRRAGRSAAMVFASYDNVRRDFQLDKINFFWLNTDKSVRIEELGAGLQMIGDRNLGKRQPVNAQGTWAFGATMFGTSVRVTTADDIRQRIGTRADGWIWGLCQIPLITLLITSLGVVNTVAASVRARRWEMGVLRAVGVTRFGLARAIVAEGILVGLVACLLSFGFGVMAGWCGTGISQYVSFFGGLNPTLVIPWMKLSLGFGLTLLLCLAAALWPAIAAGRAEPLRLLQEGRAAT